MNCPLCGNETKVSSENGYYCDNKGCSGYDVDILAYEGELAKIADEIIDICDDEIQIEGRGDDRYAYIRSLSTIRPLIDYLKEIKIPVPCPECTTLMIYQENGDLVCPHCGVVE